MLSATFKVDGVEINLAAKGEVGEVGDCAAAGEVSAWHAAARLAIELLLKWEREFPITEPMAMPDRVASVEPPEKHR